MSTPDISAILEKYPRTESSLIEILHDVQSEHRYIPRSTTPEVAA